jgi:hypothetical protein
VEAHLSVVGAARPTLGCVVTDSAAAPPRHERSTTFSNVGSFDRPHSSRWLDRRSAAWQLRRSWLR